MTTKTIQKTENKVNITLTPQNDDFRISYIKLENNEKIELYISSLIAVDFTECSNSNGTYVAHYGYCNGIISFVYGGFVLTILYENKAEFETDKAFITAIL